jgi:hypothetical protein
MFFKMRFLNTFKMCLDFLPIYFLFFKLYTLTAGTLGVHYRCAISCTIQAESPRDRSEGPTWNLWTHLLEMSADNDNDEEDENWRYLQRLLHNRE